MESYKIELEHIKLELKYGRGEHFRSFIDQWFCLKYGYVTKTGKAAWGKIPFNEYVSKSAIGKTLNEVVHKEHIIPLDVIKNTLLNLPKDSSIDAIEAVLIDTVKFATITKEDDAQLRQHGLNKIMPAEYYEPLHLLYMDPFARYKKIGLNLFKNNC